MIEPENTFHAAKGKNVPVRQVQGRSLLESSPGKSSRKGSEVYPIMQSRYRNTLIIRLQHDFIVSILLESDAQNETKASILHTFNGRFHGPIFETVRKTLDFKIGSMNIRNLAQVLHESIALCVIYIDYCDVVQL